MEQPDFGHLVTIGEKYQAVFSITTPLAARWFFEKCVRHTMCFGLTRAEAERIERQNINFYVGHGISAEARRAQKLFGRM
jgi:hypothetical protein